MKNWILPLILFITCQTLQAQQSDFIVLKKKNNRTLKSYFPGTFISASTYSGFTLNGLIQKIANDTIWVEQQTVRQVATRFGVPALDTTFYIIAVHYRELYKFNYDKHTGPGGQVRQTGWSQVGIPKIMMIGGIGYLILELVNTGYRKESLSDGNKLTGIAIAAGIATAGFVWKQLVKRGDRAGGKYRVVYIQM